MKYAVAVYDREYDVNVVHIVSGNSDTEAIINAAIEDLDKEPRGPMSDEDKQFLAELSLEEEGRIFAQIDKKFNLNISIPDRLF